MSNSSREENKHAKRYAPKGRAQPSRGAKAPRGGNRFEVLNRSDRSASESDDDYRAPFRPVQRGSLAEKGDGRVGRISKDRAKREASTRKLLEECNLEDEEEREHYGIAANHDVDAMRAWEKRHGPLKTATPLGVEGREMTREESKNPFVPPAGMPSDHPAVSVSTQLSASRDYYTPNATFMESVKPHTGTSKYCKEFLTSGGCRYGDNCRYSHHADDMPPCHYGPNCQHNVCRFNHSINSVPKGTRDVFISPYILDAKQQAMINASMGGHVVVDKQAKHHTHPCTALERRACRQYIADMIKATTTHALTVELNGNKRFWQHLGSPIRTVGLETDKSTQLLIQDKFSHTFKNHAEAQAAWFVEPLSSAVTGRRTGVATVFGVNSGLFGNASPAFLCECLDIYEMYIGLSIPTAITGSFYGGETTWNFLGDTTDFCHEGETVREMSHHLWMSNGGINVFVRGAWRTIHSKLVYAIGHVCIYALSVNETNDALYTFHADGSLQCILPRVNVPLDRTCFAHYKGTRMICCSSTPLSNDGALVEFFAELFQAAPWAMYQTGGTYLILTKGTTFVFSLAGFSVVIGKITGRTIDNNTKTIARASYCSFIKSSKDTEPPGSDLAFDVIFLLAAKVIGRSSTVMTSFPIFSKATEFFSNVTGIETSNRIRDEELKSGADKMVSGRIKNAVLYTSIGVIAAVALGKIAPKQPEVVSKAHADFLAANKAKFAAYDAKQQAMLKSWRGELPYELMFPNSTEIKLWLPSSTVLLPFGRNMDFNPFNVIPFAINIVRDIFACFRSDPSQFIEHFLIHTTFVLPYVVFEEWAKRTIPYGHLAVILTETLSVYLADAPCPFWWKFALHGIFWACPTPLAIIIHWFWNSAVFAAHTTPKAAGQLTLLQTVLLLVCVYFILTFTGRAYDQDGAPIAVDDPIKFLKDSIKSGENYVLNGSWSVPVTDFELPSLETNPVLGSPHPKARIEIGDYTAPINTPSYNVGPIFLGGVPVNISSGTDSEYATIVHRCVPYRPEDSLMPAVVFYYYMEHAFKKRPKEMPVVTFEQWNSRFPASRQLCHLRAYNEWQGKHVPDECYKIKNFQKHESLPISPDSDYDDKVKRGISALPDEINVATGPYSLAFTKWMNLHWDGSFPSDIKMLFASGWTAERVSAFAFLGLEDLDLPEMYAGEGYSREDWHNFVAQPFFRGQDEYQYGLDGDFSTMDGTVNRFWLQVERQFMVCAGVPQHVCDVYARLGKVRGRSPHDVSYTVNGTRLSGMATTSVCNSLITGLAHYYFLRANGITEARILVLGDDVNVISKVPIAHLDWVGFFNQCDLKYKPNFLRPRFMSFCSNYYWPCDTGLVLGPKPFRVISKLGLTLTKPKNKKQHIVSVAKGLVNDCFHVPILSEYLVWILTKACKDTRAPVSPKYDFHFHVSQRHQPVPATYTFFEQMYGVTFAQVLAEMQRLVFDKDDVLMVVNSPLFIHCLKIDIGGLPEGHEAFQSC